MTPVSIWSANMFFEFRSCKSGLSGGLLAVVVSASAALGEGAVDGKTVADLSDGTPARYSLVKVDEEVLRIDRQNGTVSVCGQKNGSWRCTPVPLAEEAYQAEISDLSLEVDRLRARLTDLEKDTEGNGVPVPPGAAIDRSAENDQTTDEDAPSSGLSERDEKELDKMLTFTESAMRRLFGMVRELQKDLEGSEN